MAMAPLTRDKDKVRTSFIRAKELFEEMKGEKIVGPEFTEISMGMSSDYQIAVEEGATILRIGSAIFSSWYLKKIRYTFFHIPTQTLSYWN